MTRKIYTGYYAKTNKYKEANLFTMAISQTIPKGIEVHGVCEYLAPSNDILWKYKNGEINEFEYTEMYKKQLNSNKSLAEDIRLMVDLICKSYDSLVLLCYEKPNTFCHRHILADWIEDNCGIVVDECIID